MRRAAGACPGLRVIGPLSSPRHLGGDVRRGPSDAWQRADQTVPRTSTPEVGVTGESETKQEDEKPLFSEAIGHGEHPEGTDSSPSLQPQTETFQAQLYSQAQSQVPYTQTQTYPLSHAPSPSHTQVPAPAQVLTHASYAQSQQLPYPQQQAQPQLPSPQQQPQPQTTMQYGQPNPQQAQQQTQQQAPYTQPYPPQQQASYTQVQVFTNSQPTGGGPQRARWRLGCWRYSLALLASISFTLAVQARASSYSCWISFLDGPSSYQAS